ncbi:MAG: endo-1,4-beta-xylanase [Granulosicoccus sp.]|nr:endo-1,4-beta-xylanase [Granulosicoccus sp.]
MHTLHTKQTIKLGIAIVMAGCLIACSEDEPSEPAAEMNPTTDQDATGDPDTNGDPDTTGDPDANNPGSATVSLPALPSPPLTSAPGSSSEPVAESPNFNTAIGFGLQSNQFAPLSAVVENDLTDADFNAGTPEPQLEIPSDVDPSINAAPYFEGIQNIQVAAGELLEIVYKPLDPDGELPGMFPVSLPRGATFDDNFDGSKTFRWTPLQQDVGVREFAVTAVDPQNAAYRYTQNIRIRIVLPADPSTIPNEAPFLARLPDFAYTVRVGDPVVIELSGIDRNNTTPIVEIPNLPPGAILNAHPLRSGVFVLKFVPTAAGNLNLQVQLRDEMDATLITNEPFNITVQPQNYPVRNGSRLKDLASGRSILFGYASLQNYYHQPDGALYADIAAQEYNLVSPEGSMKMEIINPLPGRYDFADTDNLIAFAKLHGMQVHGHPLVWYRQNPQWIETAASENLQGHMQEHIHRLVSRYKDDVTIWDVVNEPIADNGGLRDSIWFRAMGEDYIDIALLQARASDPDAILLINEFDAAIPGPKRDSLFTLLSDLKARQTPLDGVGFQLHVFASFDQFEEVRQSFQRVADLNLDIYITELDVSLNDGATLQQQASVYSQLVGLCLEQPRCKAIQTWGFTDQYSFRRIFNPHVFDRTYQEKPAYSAIQQRLSQ